jgi:hypothetical protein
VGGRSKRVMLRDALFFLPGAVRCREFLAYIGNWLPRRCSAGRNGDDRAEEWARGGLTRSRLLDIGGLSMPLTLD